MSAPPYSIIHYEARLAPDWRALNESWIAEAGFKLEPKDQLVLNDPEGQVLARGGVICLAIDAGGQAVGCGSLMPHSKDCLEIAKMAVTPAARGKGLSKLLMQALIKEAINQGAGCLYIETSSTLIPAVRLYESLGFVYLPAQDTPYARADVFMEKWL